MVQTLNISLPKALSIKVDEVIEEEGYTSRSEFFRTLLRLYFHLVEKSEPFFVPFKKQSLAKIERDLAEAGFYNQKFIKSVVSGLKKSSLYADKAP